MLIESYDNSFIIFPTGIICCSIRLLNVPIRLKMCVCILLNLHVLETPLIFKTHTSARFYADLSLFIKWEILKWRPIHYTS